MYLTVCQKYQRQNGSKICHVKHCVELMCSLTVHVLHYIEVYFGVYCLYTNCWAPEVKTSVGNKNGKAATQDESKYVLHFAVFAVLLYKKENGLCVQKNVLRYLGTNVCFSKCAKFII